MNFETSSQTHTLNIACYGATTNGTSTAIQVSFYVMHMHAHCNSLCVMFVSCVATTTTIALFPVFPLAICCILYITQGESLEDLVYYVHDEYATKSA